MPATDIDALLPGALTAVAAALSNGDEPQVQWQTAASLLLATGRTPPAAMADVYELAVQILQARAASGDPDVARWAADFIVTFESHFPAPTP